jgi:hypothetical protein
MREEAQREYEVCEWPVGLACHPSGVVLGWTGIKTLQYFREAGHRLRGKPCR